MFYKNPATRAVHSLKFGSHDLQPTEIGASSQGPLHTIRFEDRITLS